MSSDHTMTTTSPQPAYKAVRFLAAGTIGVALLFLSGITLTGTVIAVILATPILVLFSPILVPAMIVLFLLTAGFFFSGGFGATALMALVWMYKYLTGKHPMGADKLDYARGKIAETARDVTERAKEYGHYVQQKAQDATTTTTTTTDQTTPTRGA